jgi:hypothetical protein
MVETDRPNQRHGYLEDRARDAGMKTQREGADA